MNAASIFRSVLIENDRVDWNIEQAAIAFLLVRQTGSAYSETGASLHNLITLICVSRGLSRTAARGMIADRAAAIGKEFRRTKGNQ